VAAAGGCGAGKVSGGSCRKGARMAAKVQALTMGAEAIYKSVSSKYNKTGEVHADLQGQSDTGYQLEDDVLQQVKNGEIEAPFGSDQHHLMKKAARLKYVDAFSEFHDGLHDIFTDVLGNADIITNNQVGLILTMPHSFGLTLLAASRPYNYSYTIYRQIEDNY
jgi:hypothetical protein